MTGSDIINLETFKRYLDIKDTESDAFLKTILDEAFQFASTYTGRELAYGNYKEDFYYDTQEIYIGGFGKWYVKVNAFPIDLTQPLHLYFDGDEITDLSEHIIKIHERKVFIDATPDEYLTLDYWGGYKSDNIPKDLEYAIIELGAMLWNESKGTIGLKALKLGSEEIQVLEDNIPARAKEILNRYKVITI